MTMTDGEMELNRMRAQSLADSWSSTQQRREQRRQDRAAGLRSWGWSDEEVVRLSRIEPVSVAHIDAGMDWISGNHPFLPLPALSSNGYALLTAWLHGVADEIAGRDELHQPALAEADNLAAYNAGARLARGVAG